MSPPRLHFGSFDLDAGSGELRRAGRLIRLPPQPARLLCLLASRTGALVTREEIQAHLWPKDTFVDFDLGINHCLKRIRAALGDNAQAPRFIETLPRRGYRFLQPVECIADGEVPLVAVLPFENLNHDPAVDYFADGVTDALITELARLECLQVISRQSILHLKGTTRPLSEVASELGVSAVVEGAALHEGARVRITAQLVLVAPERHIWAESYECDMRDLLATQRRVVKAVACGVEAKLAPKDHAHLDRDDRVNPEAHEAYLKARHHQARWTRDGFEKALHYLHGALAIDAGYAPAHAQLAFCLSLFGYWGHVPVAQAFPPAKEAALRALALDDTLTAAHEALAWVKWLYDRDLHGAERDIRHGLALSPSDANAHVMLAVFLATVRGDGEGAVAEGRTALRVDPISEFTNFSMAWVYLFARDYERAREQALRTREMYPDSLQACYVLGLSAVGSGNGAEALAAFEEAKRLSQDDLTVGYLAHANARFGKHEEARSGLAELLGRADCGHVSTKAMIVAYAGLGDRDRAFEWLERAFEQRDGILYWLRAVPVFDPLRPDPRFDGLVRRLGMA